MKLVLVGLAVVVLPVVLMAIGGALLPKQHTASGSVFVQAAPADVFERVDDVAHSPRWRTGLDSVEGDRDRFVELARGDRLPMKVVERQAPSHRVTVIDDPSLPFGGTWTWTFEADGSGTRVSVREDGEVRNVVFRFLSRFVFGHRATIDRLLGDLARSFSSQR